MNFNKSDSELASLAQGIARCLTYNDKKEGEIKHVLLELSHRLDSTNIKAVKKGLSVTFFTVRGASRRATFKETLAFLLFGSIPRRL